MSTEVTETQTVLIDGNDDVRATSGAGPDHHPDQLAFDFYVDIDGFEGPIDLLLHLARRQKVDLAQLSILQLANQYLELIHNLSARHLTVAADYLVMAAWLAFLKSRLLLPQDQIADDEEEALTPEALEQALTLRLQRLEAMQQVGRQLMHQPRLGQSVFVRPFREEQAIQVVEKAIYDVSLYDLLAAYGDIKRKEVTQSFSIPASRYFSVEDSLQRLRQVFGEQMVPSWTVLWSYLPENSLAGIESEGQDHGIPRRSAMASTFVASLDLARRGIADLQQDHAFGPIYIRSSSRAPASQTAQN